MSDDLKYPRMFGALVSCLTIEEQARIADELRRYVARGTADPEAIEAFTNVADYLDRRQRTVAV